MPCELKLPWSVTMKVEKADVVMQLEFGTEWVYSLAPGYHVVESALLWAFLDGRQCQMDFGLRRRLAAAVPAASLVVAGNLYVDSHVIPGELVNLCACFQSQRQHSETTTFPTRSTTKRDDD